MGLFQLALIIVCIASSITITITYLAYRIRLYWFINRSSQGTAIEIQIIAGQGTSRKPAPVIDIKDLRLRQKLGQGMSADVFVAVWRDHSPTKVAVKVFRRDKFEVVAKTEADIHYNLIHENVVKIYGIANSKMETMLVIEFMKLGDLRTYLIHYEPKNESNNYPKVLGLGERELLRISHQIANGLAFLTSQNIVHRDLAARNCLVSRERPNSPVTVKISDFGLSRRLYCDRYYKIKSNPKLPLRWLAPECITHGKFTHESDIWSYGVTLWEVYSYGGKPYGELTDREVQNAILAGIPLEQPKYCPDSVFELMKKSWKKSPCDRITANMMKENLAQLIEEQENLELQRDSSVKIIHF